LPRKWHERAVQMGHLWPIHAAWTIEAVPEP
jgi:hypothetical protein